MVSNALFGTTNLINEWSPYQLNFNAIYLQNPRAAWADYNGNGYVGSGYGLGLADNGSVSIGFGSAGNTGYYLNLNTNGTIDVGGNVIVNASGQVQAEVLPDFAKKPFFILAVGASQGGGIYTYTNATWIAGGTNILPAGQVASPYYPWPEQLWLQMSNASPAIYANLQASGVDSRSPVDWGSHRSGLYKSVTGGTGIYQDWLALAAPTNINGNVGGVFNPTTPNGQYWQANILPRNGNVNCLVVLDSVDNNCTTNSAAGDYFTGDAATVLQTIESYYLTNVATMRAWGTNVFICVKTTYDGSDFGGAAANYSNTHYTRNWIRNRLNDWIRTTLATNVDWVFDEAIENNPGEHPEYTIDGIIHGNLAWHQADGALLWNTLKKPRHQSLPGLRERHVASQFVMQPGGTMMMEQWGTSTNAVPTDGSNLVASLWTTAITNTPTGAAFFGNGSGLTNLNPSFITNAPWLTNYTLPSYVVTNPYSLTPSQSNVVNNAFTNGQIIPATNISGLPTTNVFLPTNGSAQFLTGLPTTNTFALTNDTRALILTNAANVFAGNSVNVSTNVTIGGAGSSINGLAVTNGGFISSGSGRINNPTFQVGNSGGGTYATIQFLGGVNSTVQYDNARTAFTFNTAAANGFLFFQNVAFAGSVYASNSIATYASNTLAPSSISFPATTVNWTNTFGKNIFVFIDNGAGVTATAIKKNGTTIFTLATDVTIPLQPNEYFSETYSVGSPTATWCPY